MRGSSAMPAMNIEALESRVQVARAAFACAFTDSNEYEADLIRERRAAGAYGPSARGRALALALVLAGALLILLVFL
ncbi:MAG: hypothetical protein K8H87_00815 [Pseudorhodoplanes sp.]|nr:hypothetical protein [Pseudorhodoplanes sp.]